MVAVKLNIALRMFKSGHFYFSPYEYKLGDLLFPYRISGLYDIHI